MIERIGDIMNEVSKSTDLCLMLDNKEEEEREQPWIIDSECSTHMTGSQKKFISLQPHEGGSITFGGGIKGQFIRNVQVKLNKKTLIDNVNLVKDLKFDLFSVSKLCENGRVCLKREDETFREFEAVMKKT